MGRSSSNPWDSGLNSAGRAKIGKRGLQQTMLTKAARIIEHPSIIRRKLRWYLEVLTKKQREDRAEKYSIQNNLDEVFSHGHSKEFAPNTFDLVNLHREIRQRKSKCVLEFGVGFSTIAMCDALCRNEINGHGEGHLWVVDTSEKWIDNTRKKMPEHLRKYVEFIQGKAVVTEHNGQLCHAFEELPDISPDFIYLDGPGGDDVHGQYKGLGFKSDPYKRTVISSDVLLYESSITKGSRFLMIVDGRYNNVQFLKRNLKRRNFVREYDLMKYSTFELVE